MSKYYDMNIWDYLGHETSYEMSPKWRIDVHECDEHFDNRSDMPEQIIYLSDLQAEMLTLGVSEEDGGDYGEDSDFWLDPLTFLAVYKNIPRKVRRILEGLAA